MEIMLQQKLHYNRNHKGIYVVMETVIEITVQSNMMDIMMKII